MYINAKNLELRQSGATNNWTITGEAGSRRAGTAKNDLFQSIGGDQLVGGAGDDIYNLWDSTSTVVENAGQGIDTVYVRYWGGITLANNVENVFLSSPGATWATGNALNNVLVAGSVGATLDGGRGDDVLVGGAGADIFKLKAGNGSDVVVNFRVGWDTVQLNGYGIDSFTALKKVAAQTGSDVAVKLSATETLILRDVQLSSLSAADFSLPLETVMATNYDRVMTKAEQVQNVNGWFVLNNSWGSTHLTQGKDFSISSSYNSKDMTGGTTFNWSYAVNTDVTPQVLAYPAMMFGSAPLNTYGNPNDKANVFPVKVSDIVNLTAKYDVSFGGHVSGFNVAYDIWLSNSPTATGKAAITNEIMVWVHQGSFEGFGTQVGTYTKGDFSAKIFHTGTYTAIIADKDVPAGTIDIGDIIAQLKTMGIVADSEYVRSVELGAEVVSGSGWLTINDLDLTVATKTAAGGTITKLVTGTGTTVTETPPPSRTSIANDFAAIATPGAKAIVDEYGYMIGTQTTKVGTNGAVTITMTDLAGKLTGRDVVTKVGSIITTKHYNGAGVLTGTDQQNYSVDNSISTHRYDATGKFAGADSLTVLADGTANTYLYNAKWVLTGVDSIKTGADGAVTTQHFDAKWNVVGAERVITTATTETTQYYGKNYAFLSSDTVTHKADGSTVVEHYSANYTLTAAELIKVANGVTATYFYDGKYVLTGSERTSLDANGVHKTLSYDSLYRLTGTEFTGTDRADTLKGSSGKTDFHGGLGSDKLTGGAGVDYFHFDTAIGQGDVDTISAFQVAKDKIVLDEAIFTALGSAGALDPTMFVVGTKATSADHHLLYNKAAGALYYDADGNGAQTPILLAKIASDGALTASNFLIAA